MNKAIIKDSMKLFEPLGKIKSHSMFGGYGIFADEIMFAMVANGLLHIRADKDTTKHFKQQGFRPYIYKKRGRPVVTKYFTITEELWKEQKQSCSLLLSLSPQQKKREPLNLPLSQLDSEIFPTFESPLSVC